METLVWRYLACDQFILIWLLLISMVVGITLYSNINFFIPFITNFFNGIRHGGPKFRPATQSGSRPSALVVIPSLLRDEYDLKEIIAAVNSCMHNRYPDEMFIIASADGRSESPEMYRELQTWVAKQECPKNIHLLTSCNEVRRGKLMAVETAVDMLKDMVSEGKFATFPQVFVSMDADSTLNEHAIERLVDTLTKRNWITGNYRKAVASQVCLDPSQFWRGWKFFFSIQGQNYLNVARGFFSYALVRHNVGSVPWVALPGQLYVIWSDIVLEAPKFMGFFQTITKWHWIKWWFGFGVPKLSEYNGPSLPEALVGSTDDTSLAILTLISHWVNGKLSLELPQTPLHAFGRLLHEWFIERSHHYEPDAKIYTFTPPTLKSLWAQRGRWNSCRIEAGMRFNKPFWFFWNAAIPYSCGLLQRVVPVFAYLTYFVMIPIWVFGTTSLPYMLITGWFVSMLFNTLYLTAALLLEKERAKYWRVLLTIPTEDIFSLVYTLYTTIWGMGKDIFGWGANYRFYPERTLLKGRSQRIAIAYRVQRFITLCWRSIRYGDVPFGSWWFGWYEKPEYGLQNGFYGWTSGKKAKYVLR